MFSMVDIFEKKNAFWLDFFFARNVEKFYIRLFAHSKLDESSPQQKYLSFFFDFALDPSFRFKIDKKEA